jgi:ubiquinone/menaquinone biosynthesis C-methylase UbiE
MCAKPEYLLGHSDQEVERLQLQAECLEGLTRRLIRECGIASGMRVLDLGTGVGDVAMLVAETVGPRGTVVGVDAEERAVAAARRRAKEAGLNQIEFVVGTDQDLEKLGPFDAAIGRLVLVHQPDPVATIGRVAKAVRSGGIVAFLEAAAHISPPMIPELPLNRAASESMLKFMRVALPNYDIAGRIIPCFVDAGLPEPRVLWESIVPAGSDMKYLRWFVLMYQTFLPFMERFGVVDPAVGDPATLQDRLIEEWRPARAQGATPPYASAWAIRP